MKKNKLKILLLSLVILLSFYLYNCGNNPDSDSPMTVYFKPKTIELLEQDLDPVLKKIDKSKKYKIEGSTCSEDKASEIEEKLAIAERRAEYAGKILRDHGVPAENITTVAYDEGSECKARIIEVGER